MAILLISRFRQDLTPIHRGNTLVVACWFWKKQVLGNTPLPRLLLT